MARVIKLVSFDLDGTLIPGDTVSLALARHLGREAETRDLEARFRRGEISNAVVAQVSGAAFAGRTVAVLEPALAALALLSGIGETLAELKRRNIAVVLGTITWRFAAEYFRRRFGFDACSGTEMGEAEGRLTGKVVRPFGPEDKPAFVTGHCEKLGIALADCAAIGDSASDLPLFRAVGLAIALNGTAEARGAATVALETRNLVDVLPWLVPRH